MSLPYSSSSPADSAEKANECLAAGAAIYKLLEMDLKPRVRRVSAERAVWSGAWDSRRCEGRLRLLVVVWAAQHAPAAAAFCCGCVLLQLLASHHAMPCRRDGHALTFDAAALALARRTS
eukprot:433695-Rhodomonas_salina.2